MAKITNRFAHFKTKASFTSRLEAGDIQESSVVFIQDANEIWTHGTYYRCGNIWSTDFTTDKEGAAEIRKKIKVGDVISIENVLFGIIASTIREEEGVNTFSMILWYTELVKTIYEWNPTTLVYDGLSSTILIDSDNFDDSISSTQITSKSLTALPTLSNTPITAADSILQAFAKTQGQLNNKANISAIPAAGTIAPKANAATAVVGTSTKYACEDHVHPAQTQVSGNAGTATKLQTPRVISVAGAVSGSATFDGSNNISINSTLNGFDASKITSGVIDIERLPKGALERLFVVSTQAEAINLVTRGEANDGDTVQVINEANTMYFVVNDQATTFPTIFRKYTAGSATSVPWSGVTDKPTFATVATSGSYNDLTNKPTIPSAYTLPTASTTVLGGVKIGSGISISSGVISATYSSVGAAAASHTHTASQVTGLATVATSGSYNDLTNKPSIPSLSGYATQSWVTSQGYLTSIPAATSSAYGGIQIGYTTSGKNYAVQLSNGKAYVNVPWTDTNTTYSSGTNISISGTTINCTYSYTLPTATSSVLGGVKVGSNITLSSGTISLSKANVTSALGYTPANTSDIPEIPIALPNLYALTINGTSYTGSSAVSINTARILSTSTLSSSTVSAGYSYNNTSSRTISSLSGFSASNPDSVIISTAKLTFAVPNVIKMDGLADLSGTYYIYCLSYMANGKIAVNGAVYA